MNKFLVLACATVGMAASGASSARAAQPVNTLPAVAHINETVVVVHRHHHYRHWRHHRRWYWRHHRRYYY